MSSQPTNNNGSGSANGNEQDVPRNLAYMNPRLFPEIGSGAHTYPPASLNLTAAQWLSQVQESRSPSRNRSRNTHSARTRNTYSTPPQGSRASWPYPPRASSSYAQNQPPTSGYAQSPPPASGYYPQNPPLAPGHYTTPTLRQLVLQPAGNSYTTPNSYAAHSSNPPLLPVRRSRPHRPSATPSQPPNAMPNAMAYSEWITTPSELEQLLPRLNLSPTVPPHLYLDLQGINLSRDGSISIITIYDRSLNKVFFIDVYMLGLETFTTSVGSKNTDRDRDGDIDMTADESVEKTALKPLHTNFVSLKMILESASIPKVFFDVRNDADALFSLYDIRLEGVQDLQLMELATRHTTHPRTHLSSLTTCITSLPLPSSHKSHLHSLKSTARSLFLPPLGGRYEVLNARPLSPILVHYFMQDVVHMPALWAAYEEKLWVPFWRWVVGRETEERVVGCRRGGYEVGGGKGRGWGWGFLRGLEGEFNAGKREDGEKGEEGL